MVWKLCINKQINKRSTNYENNPVVYRIDDPPKATFQITDTKLYVKYTKTHNLNYLIDPTFKKVNRLFILPFENEDDRKYLPKYYTPKDFNVLMEKVFLMYQ